MQRTLKDIFIVPPISVLDVKQGYWKKRRKDWLSLGIQSELGRDENLLSLSSLLKKKQKSTSIFDPVLCEIMYEWFTNENDLILDRFCGGSVRGVVAGKKNRKYLGIDIRDEQLKANVQQIQAFNVKNVEYSNTSDLVIPKFDFFFTCPPYFNLEVYSNQEDDLSNMSEENFWFEYENIIIESLSNLKDNRFAAIVVGDVRRKDGSYIKLPHKTIEIFEKAGLTFYNDLVLLQEPATAAMRAFNYMNSSRKIAKAHQNVLVFVKGNSSIATERLKKFEDTNEEPDTILKYCIEPKKDLEIS